ncbi:MAG: hypothetical protein H7844_04185 [Nitrospirae bacterium YQR-1]
MEGITGTSTITISDVSSGSIAGYSGKLVFTGATSSDEVGRIIFKQ